MGPGRVSRRRAGAARTGWRAVGVRGSEPGPSYRQREEQQVAGVSHLRPERDVARVPAIDDPRARALEREAEAVQRAQLQRVPAQLGRVWRRVVDRLQVLARGLAEPDHQVADQAVSHVVPDAVEEALRALHDPLRCIPRSMQRLAK